MNELSTLCSLYNSLSLSISLSLYNLYGDEKGVLMEKTPIATCLRCGMSA